MHTFTSIFHHVKDVYKHEYNVDFLYLLWVEICQATLKFDCVKNIAHAANGCTAKYGLMHTLTSLDFLSKSTKYVTPNLYILMNLYVSN